MKQTDRVLRHSLSGKYILVAVLCFCAYPSFAQQPKAPIMGWSSWNHFRVQIDEGMIREQADAMVASGLSAAGYRFINIDDGYFGGRDTTGKLFADAGKFPSGMKALADYIHSKGLKAGIYSEAGKNTCGSIYDKDPKGIGVGMYGHVQEDCALFFKEWGYDFLKVDWCGGERMKLDEAATYMPIIRAVKALDSTIVFNVCRWKFPGEWVIKVADSWRISSDLRPKFASILKAIDLNADLHVYASSGHYNDMDMLQVGRGMSYDEDKTHFTMWCMLNSPLLAGNDLRTMSRRTIDILTNTELIALNQDKGFRQAKRIFSKGNIEVWEKVLGEAGNEKAFAIVNRGDSAASFRWEPEQLGISDNTGLRDLWEHRMLTVKQMDQPLNIPRHGVVVWRTVAARWLPGNRK